MKSKIIYITLFTVLITLLWSCEKDEICLEEITPKLIILFYDNTNPNERKEVSNLSVQIDGINGDYTNASITSATDSIAIPIQVSQDFTKYKLTLNGGDNDNANDNTDVFQLDYTRDDVFISRSCGYKTVFYDVTSSLENDGSNWIIQIETEEDPQNILNQKTSHVKIYH